jgi:hypothetical protein
MIGYSNKESRSKVQENCIWIREEKKNSCGVIMREHVEIKKNHTNEIQ